MTTVSVEVNLDEFDDEEILEAAVEIVGRLTDHDKRSHTYIGQMLARLRLALMKADAEQSDTISTAATMTSPFDLKKLVEANPQLYRFAEPSA